MFKSRIELITELKVTPKEFDLAVAKGRVEPFKRVDPEGFVEEVYPEGEVKAALKKA